MLPLNLESWKHGFNRYNDNKIEQFRIDMRNPEGHISIVKGKSFYPLILMVTFWAQGHLTSDVELLPFYLSSIPDLFFILLPL